MKYGETVNAKIEIESYDVLRNTSIRIPFYDTNNVVVAEWNSKRSNRLFHISKTKNFLNIELGPLFLKQGTYKLAFVLNESCGIRLPVWIYKKHIIQVETKPGGASAYQLPVFQTIDHKQIP